MPDLRVFCLESCKSGATIELSAGESHHLVTVNRARVGDPVVAFNGAGLEWETRVAIAHRKAAVLEIIEERRAIPLACQITLAQALPKGGVMEEIIRQATEIGARTIIPLTTSRTQVHLDDARQTKKQEKWQSTALEAAKQCGNPWLPEIAPITALADIVATLSSYDLALVASLHPGSHPLRHWLAPFRDSSLIPPRVLWLVGPEGDFSAAEIQSTIAAGARPASLGPLVLRCDTAAAYALSVLSAAFLA